MAVSGQSNPRGERRKGGALVAVDRPVAEEADEHGRESATRYGGGLGKTRAPDALQVLEAACRPDAADSALDAAERQERRLRVGARALEDGLDALEAHVLAQKLVLLVAAEGCR